MEGFLHLLKISIELVFVVWVSIVIIFVLISSWKENPCSVARKVREQIVETRYLDKSNLADNLYVIFLFPSYFLLSLLCLLVGKIGVQKYES